CRPAAHTHTDQRTVFCRPTRRPPTPTLFPYTTLFRSSPIGTAVDRGRPRRRTTGSRRSGGGPRSRAIRPGRAGWSTACGVGRPRSEEHTSELRHVSISYAVFCLKKKKRC